MADLIDFNISEVDNSENICPDEDQENRAPKLLQSPVIVNPILKQSTKDNLIQLYTPVQKPDKGKLKVTFGENSVLQTPRIKKKEKKAVNLSAVQVQEIPQIKDVTVDIEKEKENEEWEERTSILTSIDHQDYTKYAKEFVEEVINGIPFKEDEDTSLHSVDSGIESTAMDCSEYETEPMQLPVNMANDTNNTEEDKVTQTLAMVNELLKSLEQSKETDAKRKESTEVFHAAQEAANTGPESEEEFMDCEEYMEVNEGNMAAETPLPVSVKVKEQNPEVESEIKVTIDQTLDVKCNSTIEIASDEISLEVSESVVEVKEKDVQISEIPQTDNCTTVCETSEQHQDLNVKETEQCPTTSDGSENTQTVDEKVSSNNVDNAGTSQPSIPCDNFDEQPILPKKGVYNLDDLDIDGMDPFKSKSQVVNTPDKVTDKIVTDPDSTKQSSEPVDTQIPSLPQQDMIEPTSSDTTTVKSPNPKMSAEILPVEGKQTETEDEKASSNDADNAGPSQPSISGDNFDEQPILPKKGVYNLDDLDFDSMDPFKSKSQIVNTPDKTVSNPDSNKQPCGSVDKQQASLPQQDTADATPAKSPKSKMSSETVSADGTQTEQLSVRDSDPTQHEAMDISIVDDPFKPNGQIQNSPVVKKNENFKVNLDDMEDPFKPKHQMQNSPLPSAKCAAVSEQMESLENSVAEAEKLSDVKEEKQNTMESSNSEALVPNSTSTIQSTDPNLDDMADPFKPRSQIVNSPVVGSGLPVNQTNRESLVKDDKTDKDNVQDPLNPSLQTQNSSAVQEQADGDQNVSGAEKPAPPLSNTPTKLEPDFDEIEDPFKPKKQMQNSPVVKEVEKMEINLDEVEDPFKSKNQMLNSPVAKQEDKKVNFNESKLKNQMQNSPVPKQTDRVDVDLDTIENPFQPKKQMQNSPLIQQKEIEAPFEAKNHVENSSVSKQGGTTEINLEEIEDPFQPKTQMQNSPVGKQDDEAKINFGETDEPFKPKKEIQNLPKSTLETVDKSDDLGDVACPFKVNKQIQNSPIASKETENVDINLDEIEDPFKPKKQMENSPVSKQTNKVVSDLDDINDPFKPKQQMQNSPVSKQMDQVDAELDAVDDPFKPKQQMQNSPVSKQMDQVDAELDAVDDPFKPKQQMHNSPVSIQMDKVDAELDAVDDPFKPKQQMQNSPVSKQMDKVDAELDAVDDPFKPKQQMQNSPAAKTDSIVIQKDNDKTSESTTDTSSKNIAMFADLDPFKTVGKIQDTLVSDRAVSGLKDDDDSCTDKPSGPLATEDGQSAVTEASESSQGQLKTSVSLFPLENVGEETDGDVFEVTSVTRRGNLPEDAEIGIFDGKDINENQFVSAAAVFNDPGMLDLLEQFGDSSTKQQQESSLSRMSLYVKFDPLVEANPRRISIRHSQLEQMREYGLEDTLLLLGTPPKKRRQSLCASAARNTPVGQQLLFDKEKSGTVSIQRGEVDKLFALSPSKAKSEAPSSTPKMSGFSLFEDEKEEGTELFQELIYTKTDMKKIVSMAKMEMQGIQMEKEKKWCEEKMALQDEINKAGEEKSELQHKYNTLKRENSELGGVMKIYEQTISEIKDKYEEATKERDQAFKDMEGIEAAFTTLHTRYDKARNIVDGLKKNEDAMKKYIAECRESMVEKQKQTIDMKNTYKEKIEQIQQENDKLKHQNSELHSKSEAKTKVLQMKVESLENQIEQKVKENKELIDICDGLLNNKN